MSKAARLVIGLSLVGSLSSSPSPAQQSQTLFIPELPTVEFTRPTLLDRDEGLKVAGLVALAAMLDGPVRSRALASRSPTTNQIAEVGNAVGHFRYMGPVLAAGWAVGHVSGRAGLSRAVVRATGSGLVAGGITNALKRGFGRFRPRQGSPDRFEPLSDHDSFPSGHTSLAFALATSLAYSADDKTANLFLYGAATLTGLARINDDKHWFSDVVAGAAVGYLVGRQMSIGLKDTRPLVGPGLAGLSISF